MNPIQVIIFMVFHLPLILIKEGLAMLSEFFEGMDKEKFYHNLPYFLLGFLIVLGVVLWSLGYR